MQRLVWSLGNNTPVTAYLWGGGGGAGGNDSALGGDGAGGDFVEVSFTVNNGDIIECAVGGGGGTGGSAASGAYGGASGASYTLSELHFNTRAAPNPGVNNYTNVAYCAFLNSYGVWVDPVSAANFDQTYTLNFPATGPYTFVASCDNYGYVYLDGQEILSIGGYQTTYTNTITVTAGNHSVRLVGTNTGGPGSIALTIDSTANSFCGGAGGRSGYSGTSGGGGGGGGATVILKNGNPIGVAAGGGGGGGGGNQGAARGQHAPGSAGTTGPAFTAGMNGQDKAGDGGGGGAGGGGLGGGNGGSTPGGDQGGLAGSNGLSIGSTILTGTGAIPGGTSNSFYVSPAGYGGTASYGITRASNGSPGYAVLLFNVNSQWVRYNGTYQSVSNTYIKDAGIWKPVKAVYIKDGGVWKTVNGGEVPAMTPVAGKFGSSPRPFPEPNTPTDYAPDWYFIYL